jgi:hypothetical protein
VSVPASMLLELLWWCAAVAAAVAVFVHIQLYLNHPLRRQLNEEWFAVFEASRARRYRSGELDWRLAALSGHWAREPQALNGG